MKFSDAVGSISVDTAHLQKFIDVWFNEGDQVLLRGIPNTGIRHVMNLGEDIEVIRGQSKETLETKLCLNYDTKDKISMYIQMNPLKDKDKISLYVGSKVHDIRNIYGCFIDLDVKEDAFDSKEDIKNFLSSLTMHPTIVIDNGITGGMHAYWRFVEDDISPDDSEILVRWWTYIKDKASEYKERPMKIDRLVDVTRVSRMPSSINWPTRDGQKNGTVTIAEASGTRYPYQLIKDETEESFQRFREYQRQIREKTNELRIKDVTQWWKTLSEYSDKDTVDNIRYHVSRKKEEQGYFMKPEDLLNLSTSNLNLVSKILENFVNDEIDWIDILEPHGWTLLREKENSRVWARPGRNERSAETDWSEDGINSSSAMSLLSMSDETGLSDLKDAGVVLTKGRVLLRLAFQDDFKAYLSYLLKAKKEFDTNKS